MGLLDMLMGKMGGQMIGGLGSVGKMGQAAMPPLNLQNPLPNMAQVNAQRPGAFGGGALDKLSLPALGGMQTPMMGGTGMGVQASSPAPMPPMSSPMMGGASGAPDWSKGLLNKRQNYSAGTGASGPGAWGDIDFENDNLMELMLQHPLFASDSVLGSVFGPGFAKLFGGQGGASQGAPAPGAMRPPPTQFDPEAYLQSRGVAPKPIKMPF